MARAIAPKTFATTDQAIAMSERIRPKKSTMVPPRDLRDDF